MSKGTSSAANRWVKTPELQVSSIDSLQFYINSQNAFEAIRILRQPTNKAQRTWRWRAVTYNTPAGFWTISHNPVCPLRDEARLLTFLPLRL
jgi:hypothetical protein